MALSKDLSEDIAYVDTEMRLVILGKTGMGKSTLGNLLAGEKIFTSNHGFTSVTKECQSKVFKCKGQTIQIVDTPGFCDTEMDEKTLNIELRKCLVLTSPGIHAVLFVIRITRFTKEDLQVLKTFLRMFGQPIIDHVILVFTGKDDLDVDDMSFEDMKGSMPPDLKKLMEDCKERYIVICARKTDSREEYLKEILGLITKVLDGNRGRCYTNDMFRDVEIEMRKAEEKKLNDLIEQNKEQHEKDRIEMESSLRKEIEGLRLSKEESERRLMGKLLKFEKKYQHDMKKNARNQIRDGFAKAVMGGTMGVLGSFVGNEAFEIAGQTIGAFLFGTTGATVGKYAGAVLGTAVGGYIFSKIGQAAVPVAKDDEETNTTNDPTDSTAVNRVVP